MDVPKYADIIELLKKGLSQEAREMVLNLREATMELQEENLKLRERVAGLEVELKKGKDLKFDGHVYRVDGDKTPFCPVCYDKDAKMIHLFIEDGNYGREWLCQVCCNRFGNVTG